MADVNDTTGQPNTVQSATTLLRLIEGLKEMDGAGVTELAEHADMGKSTVHRHLTTLLENEYVVQDGTTYRLGYRFLELGGHVRSHDISNLIKRKVTTLAQETNERAQYVVEEYGYGVFAYSHLGEQGVNTGIVVGSRTPLHVTSAGKAILAHLDRESVERIVETHGLSAQTEHTITSEATLYDELSSIREQGYAFDRGEYIDGLYCVGVPLIGPDDTTLGALSVAGPKYRLEGELMETELPKLIKGITNELELKIAYE